MGALQWAPSKRTPASVRAVVWPECQSYPLFATLHRINAIATTNRRRGGGIAAGKRTTAKLRALGLTGRRRETLMTGLPLAS